jgi:rhodanese-related sulfurtransferase
MMFSACAQKKETASENALDESKSPSNGLLSVTQLDGMLSQDIQVIDVRTPAEFQSGHLTGAINIDFYDDNFVGQIETLDKSKTIVVYCAVGGRSGKAYGKVKKMNFINHFDLEGGIKAWKKAGLPLE